MPEDEGVYVSGNTLGIKLIRKYKVYIDQPRSYLTVNCHTMCNIWCAELNQFDIEFNLAATIRASLYPACV